jgi:transaldolase
VSHGIGYETAGRWRGSEEVLAQFANAGIDIDALAAQLQDEGAMSFSKSWNDLMSNLCAAINPV